jgi:GMP synthase (glutamine-hydrolysing)
MLRYAPQVLSSQFHPEFTVDHMRAFIAARTAILRQEGVDPDALSEAVVPTESARSLLERFAHTALSRIRAAA